MVIAFNWTSAATGDQYGREVCCAGYWPSAMVGYLLVALMTINIDSAQVATVTDDHDADGGSDAAALAGTMVPEGTSWYQKVPAGWC